MIYSLLLIYLYIIPAIYFYWQSTDEPELLEGFQWMVPVFLWPILLPVHMVTTIVNGEDEED
jgi:hypothetical protein